MESFDPFSEWLGRPAGRPPEDHYELLGLARFEPDLDLISHAVDVMRVGIRKIRPGSHLAEWERLLDRLDAAKTCLSDSISKAAYDESIDTSSHMLNVSGEPIVTGDSPGGDAKRAVSDADTLETGAAEQGVSGGPAFVEAPPVVEDLGQEAPLEATDAAFPVIEPMARKRKRTWSAARILACAVVLLLIAIGVVLLKPWGEKPWRGGQTARQPTTPSPVVPGTEADGGTDSEQPTDGTPANPAETIPIGESPVPRAQPSPQGPAPEPTPPRVPVAQPPPPEAAPSTPDPTVDPTRQRAFQVAVTSARTALGDRDLERAAAQLNESVSLAQTDEERIETAQIEVFRAHVEAFWGSLRELIPRLESGSELLVGEMMVVVVEAGRDHVVLRVSGRNRPYSIQGMPHILAAAMAEQLFSKSHNAKALRASFLIAELQGDVDQARQLLEEASQGGAEVDELLAELSRK